MKIDPRVFIEWKWINDIHKAKRVNYLMDVESLSKDEDMWCKVNGNRSPDIHRIKMSSIWQTIFTNSEETENIFISKLKKINHCVK